MDFAKLTAPFPPDAVEWRVGSTTQNKERGMALAYIDARAVMDRLDDVCGPAGWQCRYSHAEGKTICEIGIKCGDEWVWKADGGGDTDYEAEKGALSSAFKRAAVRWGVGRYLYDLASPWVAITQHGKSYTINKEELPRLQALLKRTANSTAEPAQEPGIAGSSPAPSVNPEARRKAIEWAAEQIEWIKKAPGASAINAWDTKNIAFLDRLKANHPDLHQDILAAINARLDAFAGTP